MCLSVCLYVCISLRKFLGVWPKNTQTLAAFKDTRYIIYIAFFGMFKRGSLPFNPYLTLEVLTIYDVFTLL